MESKNRYSKLGGIQGDFHSRKWVATNQGVLYPFSLNTDFYSEICTYDNLLKAFKNARDGKTTIDYVIEFEKDLEDNLFQLRNELLFHVYKPKPLKTFILHEPKTRKINKSAFRDRIIHHALCNIIQPIFERSFIFDSYANRKGKGALKAVERFHFFHRKVSKNNALSAYVLKADIKHYFETVDHAIMLTLIQKKIKDQRVIWLIKRIFSNYSASKIGKGMPLGNLTSQFFANVYLNELDQFVKHTLRVEYYVRYVDDFVLFHTSRKVLEEYRLKIDAFLRGKLKLELHPDKSRIIPLERGTEFLGLKIFYHYTRIKKKNMQKFYRKLHYLYAQYEKKEIQYDTIYDFIEGWIAYVKNADTYTLHQKIMASVEQKFAHEISTKEVNRGRKEQRHIRYVIAEIEKKNK